jgi:orotidine 5'-phosphate decarboxylase subfamily 2
MHGIYSQRLASSYSEKQTMLCFGMDPVIERMRTDGSHSLEDEIVHYFGTILSALSHEISAVKPNAGFYLQYGTSGMRAMKRLIDASHKLGLTVIVDLKAGDIGRTSAAYARFVFEELEGDAVTLNPYMGFDALEPFTEYEERGMYVLALTSNPSIVDLQLSRLESKQMLFEKVLDKISTWSEGHPGIGAVVGAPQRDFENCLKTILRKGEPVPLLIPGVGTQGGSYGEIRQKLEGIGYPLEIVRINASSSISYAHERFPSLSSDEAAIKAVEELTGSR